MTRNKSIQQVVILATISVLSLLILQLWFLKTTSELNQKYIHDATSRALLNTADELFSHENNLNIDSNHRAKSTRVHRFSDDTYFVNVGCNINAPMLEQIIIRELKHFEINQDFEVEIFNNSKTASSHSLWKYSEEDENYIETANDSAPLPQNSKMKYYFCVYFPYYHDNIDSKVHTWYIADFFLILLMIFFGYTVYVVFRQRQLSEIQKNFVNNMTHEFKTPIAAIKLSTKVLEESQTDKQTERTKRYLKIIDEQVERLGDQVERILQASTLEDKEFQLNFSKVPINDFVGKTVHEFRGSHLEHEFQILFHPSPEEFLVQLDKLHVSNTIYNILDNAIKYCEGKAEITVKIEKKNKQIEISIADNGIGIPAEYRSKIFGRFFRVPTGNRHDVKGFGLGLDYVRKIITFHRWKIAVKENHPQGTQFIIIINRQDDNK
ncbi:MAG: sensor histidine kinase [Mangrovibacterium sp.]